MLFRSVLSASRLKEERAIQENLQRVWIAANEYFLQKNITTVETGELFAPDAGLETIRQIRPARGEDYTKVNGGTISASDSQLSLTYQKDGSLATLVYPTK